MLGKIYFAIFFHWTSMHNNTCYKVIRIKYDSERNPYMTLADRNLLALYVGDGKWCEYTSLLHSKIFRIPISHGLRGLVNFHKLKNKLCNILKKSEYPSSFKYGFKKFQSYPDRFILRFCWFSILIVFLLS